MLMLRLLLCAFIVMAMPSQALAYLAKSEADVVNRLTVDLHQSPIDLAALSYNDAQQPASPESSSHVKPSCSAIVNLSRWSVSSRTLDQTDDNNTFGADTYAAKHRLSSLFTLPIYNVDYWQGDVYASNFRLSGWKESNALYVALNSQF